MTRQIAYDRAAALPRFRSLTHRESEALLQRATIGRIAYSVHDRVDIQPISFVYRDGWIIFRTAPGAKLRGLAQNRWIAFQVDEIEDALNWRSVVLHGSAYPLDEGTDHLPGVRKEAVAELRRVIPTLGTGRDPTPERVHLFHMQIDRMTGRAATSRPVKSRADADKPRAGATKTRAAATKTRAGTVKKKTATRRPATKRAPRRRSSG